MTYLIKGPFKRRIVSFVDNVGKLIFDKRDGGCSEAIKSILLIRLDHLGDVLLTTPAIKSLKRQFPHARITMVVKEWSLEAIKHNPHIDRIVIFNPFWTVSNQEGTKTEGVAEISQLVRQLRRERFDLAVDFKGDFRNILISYLSGAKRRISYAIRGGGFLLTDVVPYELEIHEIDKNLKLLAPLGINSEDSNMDLYVDDQDMAAVEKIFAQKGIDSKRRTIAVHYGGASQYKCWDIEKFVALAEELTKDGSTNVLMFAGHYERKTFYVEGEPKKGIFIMPGMTVCQMAAAFKKCDILVCNDSGPMHIGFAIGTPTVAIFGPTFPDRFGPKDLKKNKIIHPHLACNPCWHPDRPIGCLEKNCFKSIDVEEVLAAIEQLNQMPLSTESR